MAKVLSLLQPWASLVVLGLKTIETRSWSTAYRGRLLIHAGQRRSGRVSWSASSAIRAGISDFDTLPFGMIVGEVCLDEVRRVGMLELTPDEFRRQSLEENAFSEASERFAWLLSSARCYDEPIPATGKLGLWEH